MEISKYSSTGRKKTRDEMIDTYLAQYKIKCKCGHSILMKNNKIICSYCGNYVYKNKKIEFMDKLKGELKKWNQDTLINTKNGIDQIMKK